MINSKIQDTLNVSFFTGGINTPSSRFRIYQFLNLINEEILPYQVYPFEKRSLPALESKIIAKLDKIYCAVCQTKNIIDSGIRGDRLFLERMLLYKNNITLENILFSVAKNGVIVDFDDSIFLTNSNFSFSVKNADLVIAGNAFLADWAVKYSSNVIIIPTCVDLNRYKLSSNIVRDRQSQIAIGWTGSKDNLQYLKLIAKPLRDLQKKYNFKFILIVDAQKVPDCLQGINVCLIQWDKSREIEQLKMIDIGIMPLFDDLWTRGKCGFKLIQYMAAEIFAIGSNVGVNNEIITDEKNGFLCSSESEWYEKLEWCLNNFNSSRFNQMKSVAYQTIAQKYSVQTYLNIFINSIVNLQ